MNDRIKEVRGVVVDTLIEMGTPTIQPLINALQSEHSRIRKGATVALGMLEDKAAVDPLMELLKKEEDQQVRENAVMALGMLGDKKAVDIMIQLLEDENKNIRKNAITSLGVFKDKKAVKPLSKILDTEEDVNIRRLIVVTIGEIGDVTGVDALVGALKDSDETIRENAARYLIRIGKPAIEKLISVLKDKDTDPIVKKHAVTIVGKVSKKGDKRVLNVMLAALEDENDEVRRNAAIILGRIGDKTVVNGLIKALGDKSESVQKNAAESIARIGKPAVKPLIAALSSKDEDIRGYSIYALGRIGDKRCVRYLKKIALTDKDEKVREAAKKVLKLRKF
jgi:HEAT repeat protein